MKTKLCSFTDVLSVAKRHKLAYMCNIYFYEASTVFFLYYFFLVLFNSEPFTMWAVGTTCEPKTPIKKETGSNFDIVGAVL